VSRSWVSFKAVPLQRTAFVPGLWLAASCTDDEAGKGKAAQIVQVRHTAQQTR